MTYFNTN